MLYVLCYFMITTGEIKCSPPMTSDQAMHTMIVDNAKHPFDPQVSDRTPLTLFPEPKYPPEKKRK
jgi:hypothetical protein